MLELGLLLDCLGLNLIKYVERQHVGSTDSGGQPMRTNLFRVDDEQWAKIKPLIPMNRPGQRPRNNRRILSGIIHVLKTGCRWQDCPPEYGPHRTVYNRFNRWSGCGIWQQIFETVAGSPEPPEQAALDSIHVKAHRCAGGGKRMARPPRQVVLQCWREQVCTNVSGLSAAPRPRWRSARSSPHKGAGIKCAIFRRRFSERRLTVRPSTAQPLAVTDHEAEASVDLFDLGRNCSLLP
jgi:transposase